MVILAIDPSFKALSFSLYDSDTKKVYIDTVSYPLGTSIGFEKIFDAVHVQWYQLHNKIDDYIQKNNISIDVVISEIPPPVGNFSAGLYALDYTILNSLFEKYTTIKDLFILSPSFLTKVHGRRGYKKSESTALVKYFIDEVLSDSFDVYIPDSVSDKGRVSKGRLNNDKAESFIFLLRLMVRLNINGLANKIKSEVEGLSHEGEKLLRSR
jgi:hypothetical protein|nr:MAG TPA: HOLLIDAY JUNCTION RESOLVASE [Bacteriophage sp.]DAV41825.1 MAG TPA: HOLLIDAY JUNCTION RESOLVASE [Bacteriophage sp.]